MTRRAASIDAAAALASGAVLLSTVVHIEGEFETAVRSAIGDALIVDDFETAKRLAAHLSLPVATLAGDVLRGAHLVAGGGKVEARGILGTKREIKELREKLAEERVVARTADQ